MTQYFFKEKKISHLEFIQIMRRNGLDSGYKKSHFEHLKEQAKKGNKKAINILKNLRIEQ